MPVKANSVISSLRKDRDIEPEQLIDIRQNDATDLWEALTPGKQRGHLHLINTAKRADTRAKRIAKPLIDLKS